MEKFHDYFNLILNFCTCGIFLYIAYALHKQDKKFAEKDKKLGL